MIPTRLPFAPVAVRFLAGGMVALADAHAADLHVGVDQPERWADPMASHHWQHGLGGVAIGALGYAGAALVTDERDERIAVGTAGGLVVGFGYEVGAALVADGAGSAGHSIVDPVDALWVGLFALGGAALADLTDRAITLHASGDHVAVAGVIRF